jgi:hypothetical protein
MKTLIRLTNGLGSVVVLALGLVWLYGMLKLLSEILYPSISVISVVILTIIACKHWMTGALTIAGIVLYATAWLYCTYNTFTASAVCCTGIGLWFTGGLIIPLYRMKPTSNSIQA